MIDRVLCSWKQTKWIASVLTTETAMWTSSPVSQLYLPIRCAYLVQNILSNVIKICHLAKLKEKPWGWKEGRTVKSIACSPKGNGHPLSYSQTFAAPVLGDLLTSSSTRWSTDTHADKIPMHRNEKSRQASSDIFILYLKVKFNMPSCIFSWQS